MRTIVYIMFCFGALILSINCQTTIYIQSNITTSFNGTSEDFPAKNIMEAILKTIQIRVKVVNLILLPSSFPYIIKSLPPLNQSINFKGFSSFSNEFCLVFEEMVVIDGDHEIKFENVKISAAQNISSQFLLTNNGSLVIVNADFTDDFKNLNNFIEGNQCKILLESINIINVSFENVDNFIKTTGESIISFKFLIMKNIRFFESTFLEFSSNSDYIIMNSYINSCLFNIHNSNSKQTSFLLGGNSHFLNVSFENVTFGFGNLIQINEIREKNISIVIQNSFFNNLRTDKNNLFFSLESKKANIQLINVLIVNNTITSPNGALFYLKEADLLNISMTSCIIKNNFGRILLSYYTHSIFFDRVFIFDHNIREATINLINANPCIYLENSAFYEFSKLIIDGGYSDKDVVGVIIHINYPLIKRNNGFISDLLSSSFKFSISFIRCFFTRLFSINTSWSDKGSSLSIHSDILFFIYVIECAFIQNFANKGATCIEGWGQSTLDISVINSIFLNNTALSQSPTLSIYTLLISC